MIFKCLLVVYVHYNTSTFMYCMHMYDTYVHTCLYSYYLYVCIVVVFQLAAESYLIERGIVIRICVPIVYETI